MNKSARILRKALRICLTVFVALTLIFAVVTVAAVNRGEEDLFGVHLYVVLSDSMNGDPDKDPVVQPHYFSAGDLVISVKTDPGELKVGDVITFRSPDPATQKTVTHRIKSIETDHGNGYKFTTYGTTTGAVDSEPVTDARIIGKYVAHLPKAGYFFGFLKSPPGYIVCILIPSLFLILSMTLDTVRAARESAKEKPK